MEKLLLYCTKDKYKHLYDLTYVNNGETMFAVTQHNKYSLVPNNFINGKIVAECDCDCVEEIAYERLPNGIPNDYYHFFYTDKEYDIQEKSCLDECTY